MALKGVKEAEGLFFHYKWPLTLHFVKIKNNFLGIVDSLSSFSNFSPKHIKTPLNTLDSAPNPPLLGFIP